MNTVGKATIVGLIILACVIGLVFWKVKVGGQHSEGLTKLTKQDMELIFKDAPPQALKRLAEDPELRKKQNEQIKEFLAVAEEARATGFADKPEVKEELEEIEMTIRAINYDKEKNKDKENLPPFASITKENVDAYFQKEGNNEKFDKLIKEQIEKAKKEGKIPDNFEPQPEQLEQAKEQYAKVRIMYEDAKANAGTLGEEFKAKTELQVKLQQAQYLNQRYSAEVIAEKIKTTDEELNKYLAEHPEESKVLTDKKTKADEILKRAQAGEDFGKLATEMTEDPGSKKDGGLYKDVTKGAMVPEFEKTALSLEPGQIAPTVVESKYGYHIIKLERKGMTKDKDGKEEETYDARHILVSLMADNTPDPNNPMSQMAQPMPLKEKIKADIEDKKKEELLKEIVARHKIEIAEDYEIKVPEGAENAPPPGMPQLSQEQMEQLKKQMEDAQKNAPKKEGKK